MDPYFQTYYSNRIEILYCYFKEALFNGTAPLAKRLVVVPSRAMKSWLSLKLASDKDIGIAAGIEINLLEPALKKIILATSKQDAIKEKLEPTEIELTLGLECAIREACFENPPNKNFLLLYDYIGWNREKSAHPPKAAKKRMISLAAVLAKTFIEYGVYGKKMIDSWGNKHQNHDVEPQNLGWQEHLWFAMEEMFYPWNYPAKKFSDLEIRDDLELKSLQIHLFGLSYIPPLYLQFLERVSKAVPVHFYQLSPCQKFWGDILTAKESLKLLNFWKNKNVSANMLDSLEEYILDSSPLLANFGKLGREMTNVMEEFSSQDKIEHYALPEAISNYPQYEELISDELLLEKSEDRPTDNQALDLSKSSLTLLEAVHVDMALLKSHTIQKDGQNDGQKDGTSVDQNRIVFDTYDFSIQIHAAPKARREVEVIYDRVVQILEKHSSKNFGSDLINPGDIFIMAPNIDIYLPYIRPIFQKGIVPLEIQLVESRSLMDYEVVQGFLCLLKAAKGRLLASKVLELLSFPSFRKKLNIDREGFNLIEKWIKEVKIFWGNDLEHRNELIKRDYPFNQMNVDSDVGTWDSGFQQILEGLIYNSKELLENTEDINPLNKIEFSETPYLTTLLTMMSSLVQDFKPLADGTELTLSLWVEYLKCLLEVYFSYLDEEESKDGYELLLESLSKLKTDSDILNEKAFSFETIYNVVENCLQKDSAVYREKNLNAVKFSSLLPMRTVPAKVVVLMGLGDGLYPRELKPQVLNLMFGNTLSDYCPDHVDFDRFLFLEAILSARKYLIFSYTSQEGGNMNELEPSQLVKEVMYYLDQSYLIGTELPSKLCHFKHPLDAFDAKYFNGDEKFKSYSIANYLAATAFYTKEKKQPYSFIERFYELPSAPVQVKEQLQSKPQKEISIDLNSLLSFAKNPLKSFLNLKGIYISKDEKNIQNDAELFLSDLNSWILVKEALKNSLSESVDALFFKGCKKGMISQGAFLQVGKEKFKAEVHSIERHMKTLGLENEKIFSLKFSEKYTDGLKLVPPIYLNSSVYGRIKITGSFEFTTSQGVIFLVKDELKKAIELWPAILAYSCLVKQQKLTLKNNAIFIKAKDCKIKPIEFNDFDNGEEVLLTRFVDYYLSAGQSPSPLSPDYVQRLLSAKMPLAGKYSLSEEGSEGTWTFQDSHTKWLDNNSKEIEIASTLKYWDETAKNLYASMPATWYKQKSKGHEV